MGSPTVKEAREKLQAAMRLVSDGIDGDGHYEHGNRDSWVYLKQWLKTMEEAERDSA